LLHPQPVQQQLVGDVDGSDHAGSPDAPFGRVLRSMALAGGWVIIGLMIYTVLDVILRYAFNRPFSGSFEITEFAMSAIVFLGIAYCGWLGGHVSVDILQRPLENPRLRFLPAVLTLVSGVLFAAIAWLTAEEALSTMNRVSNMMRWPHYPFQLIVALGSAMYAIVLFVQAFRILRKSGGGSPNVGQ
jgi:TRAP-type C4-dicarboxylate transport system permease small subunit